jgi:hypothetical protein
MEMPLLKLPGYFTEFWRIVVGEIETTLGGVESKTVSTPNYSELYNHAQ